MPDLTAGLEAAAGYLGDRGVLDRCRLLEGDFFHSVPPGDVYFLREILHDWPDADALGILNVIRRDAPAGSALLLIDRVLPDRVTEGHRHQSAGYATDVLYTLGSSALYALLVLKLGWARLASSSGSRRCLARRCSGRPRSRDPDSPMAERSGSPRSFEARALGRYHAAVRSRTSQEDCRPRIARGAGRARGSRPPTGKV